MSNPRDIGRRARRDLHRDRAIPALYLLGDAEPVDCTVRVHTWFDALGDIQGQPWAERKEAVPKIIFLRDEIARPVRGAVVSVEVGEAYALDNVLPPDDITVTAEVVRLTAAEATGLPVPEGV